MKILLPTDGSIFSKKAIDYLTNLDTLKESGTVVYLLNIQKKLPPAVKKNLSPEVIDEIYEMAHREILRPARKKLETAGYRVKAQIGLGKAVDNIIKTAKNLKADLIVVGSHGLTPVKGLILGSKPSAVLASCKVPLLVIRENSPMPPPRQHIGICVDGSAYSVAALQFVEKHLPLFGNNPVFHLINVLPERSTSLVSQLPGVGNDDDDTPSEAQEREMFDEMIVPLYEHFRGLDHEVKVALLKGDPAEEIGKYAESANLSLLILGTHGLGKFTAMMMGSTGMKISAETDLPIVYVQKRKHKQKEEPVEFDPDSVVISEEQLIKAHDEHTDLDISVEVQYEPTEEDKEGAKEIIEAGKEAEKELSEDADSEEKEPESSESSKEESKEKKKDKKKK
ncbi:MAG: universal stress protein [Burkholderiales bacterium]|nr:universal stress protein [Burkholderiales bacterium]